MSPKNDEEVHSDLFAVSGNIGLNLERVVCDVWQSSDLPAILIRVKLTSSNRWEEEKRSAKRGTGMKSVPMIGTTSQGGRRKARERTPEKRQTYARHRPFFPESTFPASTSSSLSFYTIIVMPLPRHQTPTVTVCGTETLSKGDSDEAEPSSCPHSGLGNQDLV